jgi:hypothetical protein
LIQLYRWFPSVLKVITIIRPETVVRWHRAGFRRIYLSAGWQTHYRGADFMEISTITNQPPKRARMWS